LRATKDEVFNLAEAMKEVKEKIQYCPICFNICETTPCPICHFLCKFCHIPCHAVKYNKHSGIIFCHKDS
ncbi:MAG: hypothetical protein KJ729_03005, partial [Euryarchaeota archaeon]|nr:hypothetical protein [Euryarchaeota archaeon]